MESYRSASLLLAVFLLVGPLLSAQSRTVDPAVSSVTVFVGKSGLFSAFGHNHQIRGPLKGEVNEHAESATIEVEAARLMVVDPGTSAKDLAEIQRTMLGPEVLDVTRFPLIRFQSEAVRRLSGGQWEVRGKLALHGQVHPVTLQVSQNNANQYRATASLKQSQFGIRPVRVAGGTVQVKDEVKLEFIIKITEP